MCKCEKIKNRCVKSFSACAVYEGVIPEDSALYEEECVSIQDVGEDLYSITTQIKQDINVSGLDNECLTIPSGTKINQLLQILITEVCAQKELITSLQETVQSQQQEIEDLQQNNCP